MKLISLNIWGGRQKQHLLDFISQHAKDTDLFCFQEVYNGNNSDSTHTGGQAADIHCRIGSVLTGFIDAHDEVYEIFYDKKYIAPFGLSIFVKSGLKIECIGTKELFLETDAHLKEGVKVWNKNLQYIKFKKNGKGILVCNLHGLYTGGGKKDVPARIAQSKKVLEFIKKQGIEAILIGDLNLDPDTESIKILENGMRNLVKECNIKTTRSNLYPRKDEMPLADYCFVTPGIKIADFQVPYVEASDHLPLILEFES